MGCYGTDTKHRIVQQQVVEFQLSGYIPPSYRVHYPVYMHTMGIGVSALAERRWSGEIRTYMSTRYMLYAYAMVIETYTCTITYEGEVGTDTTHLYKSSCSRKTLEAYTQLPVRDAE